MCGMTCRAPGLAPFRSASAAAAARATFTKKVTTITT